MSAEMARHLEGLAQELERASKKAQRRGKRKDWHRLRTTSRRLRGALIAFAGSIPRSVQPALARETRRIAKMPAKVRDLDVALTNLEILADGVATRDERKVADDLARRLTRRRNKRDRKVRRKLRRKRPVRALARQLHEAVRRVKEPAGTVLPTGDVFSASARAVLDRRAAVGGWEDDDKLHALRVAVKSYRDALSAWTDVHGRTRPQRATLESLRTLLQILGEHHDWSELARRLAARRQALTVKEARARDLAGCAALLARARQEQRECYQAYRSRFHEKLPNLISPDESALPASRATSALVSAVARDWN